MLEIIPAYKEFTILQDYGYRDGIVENPDFLKERWDDANTPHIWTKSAAGTWVERSLNNIKLIGSVTIIVSAKYIYQLPVNANFSTTGSYKLKITYKARIFPITGGKGYIQVKLDNGGAQRYLDDDGSWAALSTSDADYLNFTNHSMTTVVVETDAIPIDDADLTITIYQLVRTVYEATFGIEVESINVEVLPTDGEEYPDEDEIRTQIDTNYNFEPDKKEINIGDLPVLPNSKAAYWGGLLTSAGVPTTSWIHKGAADGDALLDHTVADILNNYDAPTHKLRGTIHSKVMDFNTVIKEGNLSNKIFIPGQMTYNPLRGTWKGEWLEIVTN